MKSMSARPKDLLRPIFDGYTPPTEFSGGKGIAKIGRPSSYTDEIAHEILTRLERGETLIDICSSKHLPERDSVYRWMDSIEGFRDRYDRARKIQAHAFVEEAVKCVREAEGKDGIQKARVMSDLLVRVAGKLNREAYGDILKIEKKDITHAELIELAQKRLEAQKAEAKTIDLAPETVISDG